MSGANSQSAEVDTVKCFTCFELCENNVTGSFCPQCPPACVPSRLTYRTYLNLTRFGTASEPAEHGRLRTGSASVAQRGARTKNSVLLTQTEGPSPDGQTTTTQHTQLLPPNNIPHTTSFLGTPGVATRHPRVTTRPAPCARPLQPAPRMSADRLAGRRPDLL